MMNATWFFLFIITFITSSTNGQVRHTIQGASTSNSRTFKWAEGRTMEHKRITPREHRPQDVVPSSRSSVVVESPPPVFETVQAAPQPPPALETVKAAPQPVVQETPQPVVRETLPLSVITPQQTRIVYHVQPVHQPALRPTVRLQGPRVGQTKPRFLTYTYVYNCLIRTDHSLQTCIQGCENNRSYLEIQRVKCEVNCYDLNYRTLGKCVTFEQTS